MLVLGMDFYRLRTLEYASIACTLGWPSGRVDTWETGSYPKQSRLRMRWLNRCNAKATVQRSQRLSQRYTFRLRDLRSLSIRKPSVSRVLIVSATSYCTLGANSA